MPKGVVVDGRVLPVGSVGWLTGHTAGSRQAERSLVNCIMLRSGTEVVLRRRVGGWTP